jgi:hypothetical protein
MQNRAVCRICFGACFGTKAALTAGQIFLQPCNRSI